MNTLSANAKEFRTALQRLRPFMSTEETRYYLNGVCLDYTKEGGLRAIATNGHILLEIGIKVSGNREPFREIVPAEAVATLLTIIPQRSYVHDASLGIEVTKKGKEAGIEFLWEKQRFFTPVIDGTFPDTGRVAVKGEKKTTYGFNISYLMAALEALIDSGAGTQTPSTFPITVLHDENDPAGPYQITAPQAENFRCMIMPMRADNADLSYSQHNVDPVQRAHDDDDDDY